MCTCVQNKLQCTSKCNCNDCDNYKPMVQRSFEVVSCRCGAARPEGYKSCLKRSRCPCSKSGAGCLVSCCCRNCHNEMGVRPILEKQQTPRAKRKDVTYKRKRGSEFFTDETETNKTEDVWSGQETAALLCCVNILLLTSIPRTSEIVYEIYSAVSNCYPVKNIGLQLGKKSLDEVTQKLGLLNLL